ncbi:LamG domain-containing protein [Lacipirellula sp.]|uniref:LamG domain-containing protein n=1 Tax=Lacipirellula sp. TaxID=2691419 RepID=UPI003D0AC73C
MLIDRYMDGDLDAQGSNDLNAWLAADEVNVRMFVRRAFVHWQLRENLVAENTALALSEVEPSQESLASAMFGGTADASGGFRRWMAHPAALLAATIAGVLVGGVSAWQVATRSVTTLPVARAPVQDSLAPRDLYVAELVNVTNCRWDTARSTADLRTGSTLRAGESLHLLEGVAQIRTGLSDNSPTVQLEGPAAISLASDGPPALLYGKLTVSLPAHATRFDFTTPLGCVHVSSDSSVGVMSSPNSVELHVFRGAATLEPGLLGAAETQEISVDSGASMRATTSAHGVISTVHGKAHESWFVTPAALTESQLPISEKYVDAVYNANPVAYWRFESDEGGVVRNQMSDRLHCRLVGDAVRLRPNSQNGTAEFGLTAGPGYLLSDDLIDLPDDSYTLEAWMKPTYYHHGTMFSLIDWKPSESPLGSHRLEVELVGPVSGFPQAFRPTEFNPGRIRYIHQNSEAFSATPYIVRKWQHLATVKNGAEMKIYLDGKLVASNRDERPVGPQLRVLMGQLFPQSPHIEDEVTSRLYVGQLDEVALYDRALSEEELRRHVQLAKPMLPAVDPDGINRDETL